MKYLTWQNGDSIKTDGWVSIQSLPFTLPTGCVIINEAIYSTDMSGIVIEIDVSMITFWISIAGELLYQICCPDYAAMNSLIAQMIGVETYDVLSPT